MKPTVNGTATFHPSVGSDFGACEARITCVHSATLVDLEYEREPGKTVGASSVPVYPRNVPTPPQGYYCLVVFEAESAPSAPAVDAAESVAAEPPAPPAAKKTARKK